MRGPPDEKGRPLQGRPHAFPWQKMRRYPDSIAVPETTDEVLKAEADFAEHAALQQRWAKDRTLRRNPYFTLKRLDAVERMVRSFEELTVGEGG